MATRLATNTWTQPKSAGTSFTVTLSRTASAGNTIVFASGGGAISTPSGGGGSWTRGPAYGGGTFDESIWYYIAVGGETSISVSLNGSGDNVNGYWVMYQETLSYVGGSSNGTGNTPDQTTDFAIAPSSVTVTGQCTGVAIWSVNTSTTYSLANRLRGLGPFGNKLLDAAEQTSGGTGVISFGGEFDLDTSHAFPVTNSNGTYAPTTTYQLGSTVFAAMAYFTDTSGVKTAPWTPTVKNENTLPGRDNGNWYLNNNGTNSTIAGFPRSPSVAQGDTLTFAVDSSGFTFRAEIYRLGWYGYDNFSARMIAMLTGTVQTQPTPVVDSTLGSTSCAAWTDNVTFAVPADATPGIYYVIFRRTDSGNTAKAATTHFVVKSSSGVSGKMVMVTPDLTHQAYNVWGATTDHGNLSTGTWTGRSLYQAGSDGAGTNFAHRAYAVCFDRPYSCQDTQGVTYIFDSEFGLINFCEMQGYDLTYLSDMDLENDATVLETAKLVMPYGHHEYWTENMYDAFDNALTSGVNMFWYSSNTAGWRVRFDSGDTNKRTAICYKDNGTRDVSAGFTGTGYDPIEQTGTWRDPNPSNGTPNPDVRLENALTGQRFVSSGPVLQQMVYDATIKAFPLWRNSSGIQALSGASTLTDISNNLGYEVDSADGSSGQPSNLVIVAQTTVAVTTGTNAAGTVYATHGNVTATWTLYRASNGTLVFNVGNWRAWWSAARWQGSSRVSSVSTDIQNALTSILYDLGCTPTTQANVLQPGTDTALIDPSTGAPTQNNTAVATAYGLSVNTIITSADFGSSVEAITFPNAALVNGDISTLFTEGATAAIAITASDTGQMSTDSQGLLASLLQSESGSLSIEATLLGVPLTGIDTITLNETGIALTGFGSSDTSAVSESQSITVIVIDHDGVTVSEQIQSLTVHLSASDVSALLDSGIVDTGFISNFVDQDFTSVVIVETLSGAVIHIQLGGNARNAGR